MNVIELRGVCVSFNNKKVLENIDLVVERGEFVGLLGETGCGKTTLLLLLNGLIPKSIKATVSGSVTVNGENIQKKSVAEMSKRIAFVFQNPDDQIFSPTAFEEVAFALRLQKLSDSVVRARVRKALKAVGLQALENADPTTLSQGQKQKLVIACAISLETPILALDEPVSSLDYRNAKEVYALLKSLNRKGKTILVVEHDTEFLEKTVDKVVVLHDRRVKKTGGAELLKSPLLERLGLRRLA